MISKEFIQAWRSVAPWNSDAQVEQDLIMSRTLCELYSEPKIRESLAFRGGTSLQKIFLSRAARFSEDIDLVQIPKEGIGDAVDVVRFKIDKWLGKPKTEFKTGRVTMRYKYESTETPAQEMKLKIEINNAEHFSVFGHQHRDFEMKSEWFSGACKVTTFAIEEIMGTKLRALYQRKKGRDLFDFACVFKDFPELSYKDVVDCFLKYMDYAGNKVSRAEFEMALSHKRIDPAFTTDIDPLLPTGTASFDPQVAFDEVGKHLISLLPGDPWKGSTRTKN